MKQALVSHYLGALLALALASANVSAQPATGNEADARSAAVKQPANTFETTYAANTAAMQEVRATTESGRGTGTQLATGREADARSAGVKQADDTFKATYDAKAAQVQELRTTTVSGQGTGTTTYSSYQPMNRVDEDVVGNLVVRDGWVQQVTAQADELDALKWAPYSEKIDFVNELRANATELDSAYVNMIASENSLSEFAAQNPRAPDPAIAFNAAMKRAQELESTGDKAAADRVRAEAYDADGYGLYMKRRQHFYQLLDQHPELGLRETTLFFFDTYLFQALENRLSYDAPDDDYLALVDGFLDQGIAERHAEAARAAAINTVDGLEEFGGPEYARTHNSITQGSQFLGMMYPALYVQRAQGAFEQRAGASAIKTATVDFTLNMVAGGAWIIPGVGPLISASVAAIQVVKEGNELRIALLDAEQAKDLGALQGYTRIITAEDRVSAETGDFMLAVGGFLLEGVTMIRLDAPATPRGTAGAVPGGAAPSPGAGNLPSAPSSAAPNASRVGAAADNAILRTPASSGQIDEIITQAQEQAAKHGIDAARLQPSIEMAQGASANMAVAATQYLSDIADIDRMLAMASDAGLAAADVQVALDRAVAAANGGNFEALKQLRGELGVMYANHNGMTVFVDPEFQNPFELYSPNLTPNSFQPTDAGPLVNIGTKLRLAARQNAPGGAQMYDIRWTAEELATIRQLQAAGGDALKWAQFIPGDGLIPIFRSDLMDNIRAAFPGGVPTGPGGAIAPAAGANAADLNNVTPNAATNPGPAGANPATGVDPDAGTLIEAPSGGIDPRSGTLIDPPRDGALRSSPANQASSAADDAISMGPATPSVPLNASPRLLSPIAGTILNLKSNDATSTAPAYDFWHGSPSAQNAPTTHVVQAGENLFRIALRYGTSMEALSTANNLASPNIFVGQQLTIPTSTDFASPGDVPLDVGSLNTNAAVAGSRVMSIQLEIVFVTRTRVGDLGGSESSRHARREGWSPKLDELFTPFETRFASRARVQTIAAGMVSEPGPARIIQASVAFAPPSVSTISVAQSLPTAPVKALFTSLGGSTGDAFEVEFLNDGPGPIDIGATGVVLEPLDDKAQKAAQKEFAQAASGRTTSKAKATAYCLELVREPPPAGMVFRVAPQELQKQFTPMRDIWRSAKQLLEVGGLSPDSDPTQYFHSIVQWSMWSKENGFDLKTFGEAFLDRTKKNFAAANQPWTDQVQQAVQQIIPNRWNDIARVLSESERLRANVLN